MSERLHIDTEHYSYIDAETRTVHHDGVKCLQCNGVFIPTNKGYVVHYGAGGLPHLTIHKTVYSDPIDWSFYSTGIYEKLSR